MEVTGECHNINEFRSSFERLVKTVKYKTEDAITKKLKSNYIRGKLLFFLCRFFRFSVCHLKMYVSEYSEHINHLMPNDHFSGRTAPLTSRCCIFYLFNKYTY